jgi:hypothetical protein
MSEKEFICKTKTHISLLQELIFRFKEKKQAKKTK